MSMGEALSPTDPGTLAAPAAGPPDTPLNRRYVCSPMGVMAMGEKGLMGTGPAAPAALVLAGPPGANGAAADPAAALAAVRAGGGAPPVGELPCGLP